ncbi:hypothetical protein MP638_000289 [Amoeboaphelidium occidentale]|nr:hypothetical protein MP638_000289 [Amoeboaphelidium occidentale]
MSTEVEEKPQAETKTRENTALMSHFWKLAEFDTKVVEQAAVALMNDLSEHKFTDAISTEEELSEKCHTDLVYTLHRLLKGLSSSRKAARPGFSTALVMILTDLVPQISASVILSLLNRYCVAAGKLKGYEEREYIFGKVFGYGALLKSKVLLNADKDSIGEVFGGLIKIGMEKPYLREACFHMMCEGCAAFETSGSAENYEIVKNLIINDSNLKDSLFPEMLPLVLKGLSAFKVEDLFGNSMDCLEQLRDILKCTTSSHPNIHSCWSYVMEYATKDVKYFDNFWKFVVEDCFLDSNSAVEKKFLAVNLLQKFGTEYEPNDELVKIMFSKPLLECILVSAVTEKMSLNLLCVQVLNDFLAPIIIKNDNVKSAFYDTVTLSSKLSSDKVVKACSQLASVFENSEQNDAQCDKRLEELCDRFMKEKDNKKMRESLDQIFAVLKTKKSISDEFIEKLLDRLVKLSFYETDAKFQGSSYVWRLVNDVLSKNKDADILMSMYNCLKNADKTMKPIRVECDEEITSIIKASEAILKKTKADSALKNILVSVLLHMITEASDEDFVGELSSVLEELNSVFSKLKNFKNEEINPYSVLVDVLLSFFAMTGLESTMKLTRLLVERAFAVISSNLDASGIDVICKAIDPVYDVADDDDILEELEDEDEVSDDDDGLEHDHSKETEESSSNGHKHDEDVEEDQEEADDSDLDDEQMVEQGFDAKLAEIFKQQKLNKKENKSKKRRIIEFRFRVLDCISVFLKHCDNSDMKENVAWALLESLVVHSNPHTDEKKLSPKLKSIAQIPNDQRMGLVQKIASLLKHKSLKENKNASPSNMKEIADNCTQLLLKIQFFGSETNVCKLVPSSEDVVTKAVLAHTLHVLSFIPEEEDILMKLMTKLGELSKKKRAVAENLAIELIRRNKCVNKSAVSDLLSKYISESAENNNKLLSFLNIAKALVSVEKDVVLSGLDLLHEDKMNKESKKLLREITKSMSVKRPAEPSEAIEPASKKAKQ